MNILKEIDALPSGDIKYVDPFNREHDAPFRTDDLKQFVCDAMAVIEEIAQRSCGDPCGSPEEAAAFLEKYKGEK